MPSKSYYWCCYICHPSIPKSMLESWIWASFIRLNYHWIRISSKNIVTSIFKSSNEDIQRIDHLKVTADKHRPVENALLVSAYLPYAHNASLVLDLGKLLRNTHFFWTFVKTVSVLFLFDSINIMYNMIHSASY